MLQVCYKPVTDIFNKKMNKKTINEFVAEMKTAFGVFELKATNFETTQILTSKGWTEPAQPLAEISIKEYRALGDLQNKILELKPNTLKKFLFMMKAKKNGTKTNQRSR